jgi:hypothetical protein
LSNNSGNEIPDAQGHQGTQETLKALAYQWLRQHLHDKSRGKIKRLADFLHEDYKTKAAYLWQLSSQFKTDVRNGLGSKCPKDQHHARAYVYAPKSCDRKLYPEVEKQALECGWELSRNRNRMLVWNKDRSIGRVEWWATGKVMIHVTKPQLLSRAKTLLASAFFEKLVFDKKLMGAFLDKVEWFGSTFVYTPEPRHRLPYLVINDFAELGHRVKMGDISHPYSLEWEWCKPQYAEKVEMLVQQCAQVISTDSQAFKKFNDLLQDLSQPKQPRPEKDRSVV